MQSWKKYLENFSYVSTIFVHNKWKDATSMVIIFLELWMFEQIIPSPQVKSWLLETNMVYTTFFTGCQTTSDLGS